MTTPNPFKQAIENLRIEAKICDENYTVRTENGDHDRAKEAYDRAVSCSTAANFLERYNPADIGSVMPDADKG